MRPLEERVLLRPDVYYNDGPFDPPSSDEEDQETLLDRDERFNGRDEEEDGVYYKPSLLNGSKVRARRMQYRHSSSRRT